MVGRTPTSAPDPQVRLFAESSKALEVGPTWASAADLGVRPTILVLFLLWVIHKQKLAAALFHDVQVLAAQQLLIAFNGRLFREQIRALG